MMGIEILKNGGGGVSWTRHSETQRKSNQIAKHRREGKQVDKLEQTSWSREGNVTHRRKVIR